MYGILHDIDERAIEYMIQSNSLIVDFVHWKSREQRKGVWPEPDAKARAFADGAHSKRFRNLADHFGPAFFFMASVKIQSYVKDDFDTSVCEEDVFYIVFVVALTEVIATDEGLQFPRRCDYPKIHRCLQLIEWPRPGKKRR
jgi:hypothetical protein